MDEEENTLRPGDGGSAAQLPLALAGIWNGEGFLTYEEENIVLPGDGGSAAKLFPDLAGRVNGERN